MTIKYNNVFIEDAYTICGNYENDGPLSKYFDKKYEKDFYFGEKSWEQAEVHLLKEANTNILKKNKLKEEDIDLLISGDYKIRLQLLTIWLENLISLFLVYLRLVLLVGKD